MTITVSRDCAWIAAKIDNGIVMINVNSKEYVELNELGTFIWDFLESPRGLEEIVDRIAAEFEATHAQIRDDLMGFLNELQKRGAVSLETA